MEIIAISFLICSFASVTKFLFENNYYMNLQLQNQNNLELFAVLFADFVLVNASVIFYLKTV